MQSRGVGRRNWGSLRHPTLGRRSPDQDTIHDAARRLRYACADDDLAFVGETGACVWTIRIKQPAKILRRTRRLV
jgi:hypothetical protein